MKSKIVKKYLEKKGGFEEQLTVQYSTKKEADADMRRIFNIIKVCESRKIEAEFKNVKGKQVWNITPRNFTKNEKKWLKHPIIEHEFKEYKKRVFNLSAVYVHKITYYISKHGWDKAVKKFGEDAVSFFFEKVEEIKVDKKFIDSEIKRLQNANHQDIARYKLDRSTLYSGFYPKHKKDYEQFDANLRVKKNIGIIHYLGMLRDKL